MLSPGRPKFCVRTVSKLSSKSFARTLRPMTPPDSAHVFCTRHRALSLTSSSSGAVVASPPSIDAWIERQRVQPALGAHLSTGVD